MENTANNDNDPFSFIALAALTANVIRFLELAEEKKEQTTRDAEKQREEDKRAYVEQRRREAALWEKRISGGKT